MIGGAPPRCDTESHSLPLSLMLSLTHSSASYLQASSTLAFAISFRAPV